MKRAEHGINISVAEDLESMNREDLATDTHLAETGESCRRHYRWPFKAELHHVEIMGTWGLGADTIVPLREGPENLKTLHL